VQAIGARILRPWPRHTNCASAQFHATVKTAHNVVAKPGRRDTVTVTFTFEPSQLSYPPGVDALQYGTSVYFDDRYFAFLSRSGISTADAGDWIFLDVGTMGAHAAYSTFFYEDHSPTKNGFTYSETFIAIGGTPETDVLTLFHFAAGASYLVAGVSRNILNVTAFEFYDVTPHAPEPSLFALSSIALAASGVWRARKSRRERARGFGGQACNALRATHTPGIRVVSRLSVARRAARLL
jgi:hypothetical protein